MGDLSYRRTALLELAGRSYYKKACDGGFLGGCNSLGLLSHLSIDGSEPNPPGAVAYYIQACDGGHLAACNNLEKLYAAGMRAEEDPPGRLALCGIATLPAAPARTPPRRPHPGAR